MEKRLQKIVFRFINPLLKMLCYNYKKRHTKRSRGGNLPDGRQFYIQMPVFDSAQTDESYFSHSLLSRGLLKKRPSFEPF